MSWGPGFAVLRAPGAAARGARPSGRGGGARGAARGARGRRRERRRRPSRPSLGGEPPVRPHPVVAQRPRCWPRAAGSRDRAPVAQRETGEQALAHEVAPASEHGRDPDARPTPQRLVQPLGRSRASALERAARAPAAAGPTNTSGRGTSPSWRAARRSAMATRILPLTARGRHAKRRVPCRRDRGDRWRARSEEDDSGAPASRLDNVGAARVNSSRWKGRPSLFTPEFVEVSRRPPRSVRPRVPCAAGAASGGASIAPCTSRAPGPAAAERNQQRRLAGSGRARRAAQARHRDLGPAAPSRTCSSTR